MTNEIELIKKDYAELQAKVSRYREKLSDMEAEMFKLETTLGVLEQYTGADSPKPKKSISFKKTRVVGKPDGLPTTREMVLEALMDVRARGGAGLTPKEIRQYVKDKYDFNMGAAANTVPSRMWRHTKEIAKNTETGKFSLPERIETKDTAVESKPSLASLFSPAKDREVGSGGGP